MKEVKTSSEFINIELSVVFATTFSTKNVFDSLMLHMQQKFFELAVTVLENYKENF